MPDTVISFSRSFLCRVGMCVFKFNLLLLERYVHVGFPGKWALRWKVAYKKFIRAHEKVTIVEGKGKGTG